MIFDIYFVTRLITVLLFLIAIGLAVRARSIATMETWMYWLAGASGLLIVVQWTTGWISWVALGFYAISCFRFGMALRWAIDKQRLTQMEQRLARIKERRSHANTDR